MPCGVGCWRRRLRRLAVQRAGRHGGVACAAAGGLASSRGGAGGRCGHRRTPVVLHPRLRAGTGRVDGAVQTAHAAEAAPGGAAAGHAVPAVRGRVQRRGGGRRRGARRGGGGARDRMPGAGRDGHQAAVQARASHGAGVCVRQPQRGGASGSPRWPQRPGVRGRGLRRRAATASGGAGAVRGGSAARPHGRGAHRRRAGAWSARGALLACCARCTRLGHAGAPQRASGVADRISQAHPIRARHLDGLLGE